MIRYDTATMAGFQGSAAFGEDDRWDITLRYAAEHAGFRIAAGIGYGVDTDELPAAGINEKRFLGGSVAVLHVSSGLFAQGSYAKRTNEFVAAIKDADETYWGLRAGIAKNWFGIGNTVVYGEYNHWDNEVANNEAAMWGASIIQNVDAAALELYLSYKNLSVDKAQVGPINEDAHVLLSGARIKF
jgi:hypothetical protein